MNPFLPTRRDVLRALLALPLIVPRVTRAAADATAVAEAMNDTELTDGFVADARVELRRGGSSRVRELGIAVMRQGASDESLRRYGFTAPSDIRGTRLLVRENDEADNDLWLFLPAMGRTRRITASNQSGSFAGTDFSYADMQTMRLEKYAHRIVREDGESIELESRVSDADYARSIGYSRLLTTMSDDGLIPFQVDYFDLEERHLKTQRMSDPAPAPDGAHILRRRVMTVEGRDQETEILISELDFDSRLRGADFDPRRLADRS